MPCGTARIERSEGNFIYTNVDYDFVNKKYDFSPDRTYNFLSSKVGILGRRWSTWFERKVYIDENGTLLTCEYGEHCSTRCQV